MAKRKEIPEMEKVHLEIAYDAIIHKQLTDLLKSDKDITLTIKMHGPLVQMSSEVKNHGKNALICCLALASTLSAIVADFEVDSEVAGWRELTNTAYLRALARILENDAKADGANNMYIIHKREEKEDDDAAE